MPFVTSSFLLLVVRPGAPLVASLVLVAMPFVTGSFLLLVVRPGAPLVASLYMNHAFIFFSAKGWTCMERCRAQVGRQTPTSLLLDRLQGKLRRLEEQLRRRKSEADIDSGPVGPT